VYEILAFTDEMRLKVREGGSPSEIMTIARKGDFITMREDGMLKVIRGKTTIDELFNVLD
jgi:type II secretory ATPase GspE/PulE/Tfp pilus assembly ATPase PilB-like protein